MCSDKELFLRPHHLICLLCRRGENAFPGAPQLAPQTMIRITRGSDALCASCPDCIDGECAQLAAARRLDILYKGVMGLSFGDTAPYLELMRRAARSIESDGVFCVACEGCKHFAECLAVRNEALGDTEPPDTQQST